MVTQIDGRRFVETPDGSRKEISTESADEDGKWAVLDEAAALGLSPSEEETSSAPPTTTNALNLTNLVKSASPSVGPYLQLLQVGVPYEAVKSKAAADQAAGSVPQGTVELFLETMATATAAQQRQEKQPPRPPQQQQQHLVGSHAEKHGWLGDTAWEAPVVAVACDVEARAGYNSAKSHEVWFD